MVDLKNRVIALMLLKAASIRAMDRMAGMLVSTRTQNEFALSRDCSSRLSVGGS
jgi:hypothetical protein